MNTKYLLWLHLKNSLGKKNAKRNRQVAFLVDDYANVRLDGIAARKALEEKGYIDGKNRFDLYDTLETQSDLEALFEVLNSVKDAKGGNAVFTPMAVSANINFEGLRTHSFDHYRLITVNDTFKRQAEKYPSEYEKVWSLWEEGMREGIFTPQFHGREHLSVSALNGLLNSKNDKLLASLNLDSLIGGAYSSNSARLLEAFGSVAEQDRKTHPKIVAEGVSLFKSTFKIAPILFTSPGGYAYKGLEKALAEVGVKAIDTYFVGQEAKEHGVYQRNWHYHGEKNTLGQRYILRNAVFEPTSSSNTDALIAQTLKEIEIAFFWNKPAIISSHRVNFCGFINENNRKTGLSALSKLLKTIIKKWPDAEFISGTKLVENL